MTIEIVFIFCLILANGVLAMSEIALVSVRRARLQQMAEEGSGGAKAALELIQEPNRFLATVQVGITLVGVLAGAYGGATVAERLGARLDQIPALMGYGEAVGVAFVVLVISYLSLILGELVPKRIALQNPERIATRVAVPMRYVARLFGPAVRLLSLSTEVVVRLLGLQPSGEPTVTEEEIKIMLEQGTQEGIFQAAEQDMVGRVFRLADKQVGDLMTPRPRVVWVDLNDSLESNLRVMADAGFSHFPACNEDLDNMQGVISVKKLWARVVRGEPLDLMAALERHLNVPETMPALRMLEQFKQHGTHMALVIDEYGGVEGLVTPFDVLEAIVGDIAEPGEAGDLEVVQREDGSWLVDGLLPIDELREILDFGLLPGEEEGYFQTVGGFAMMHLGRIPATGDHFIWQRLRLEVVDMDGNRVDKLLIMRLPDEADEEGVE